MAIKFTEKVGSNPTPSERSGKPASSPATETAAKKKPKSKKQAPSE